MISLSTADANSPADFQRRIADQYSRLQGDSTALFEEIIAAAAVVGMDSALAMLESCCMSKRLAWIHTHFSGPTPSDDMAVQTGFDWFYVNYLHVHLPGDGEVVEATPDQIISRWWNPCPTLDACRKLGLDTREVCRKAYHRPVDSFLQVIHPGLRFERNYHCLRPHTPCCEEIIRLVAPADK